MRRTRGRAQRLTPPSPAFVPARAQRHPQILASAPSFSSCPRLPGQGLFRWSSHAGPERDHFKQGLRKSTQLKEGPTDNIHETANVHGDAILFKKIINRRPQVSTLRSWQSVHHFTLYLSLIFNLDFAYRAV